MVQRPGRHPAQLWSRRQISRKEHGVCVHNHDPQMPPTRRLSINGGCPPICTKLTPNASLRNGHAQTLPQPNATQTGTKLTPNAGLPRSDAQTLPPTQHPMPPELEQS